jgi:tRNA(Ile)-lysidine synthase
MLLLDFSAAYSGEAGFLPAAVHFNHHLRASESDADEAFVRERAQQLGVACLCSGADVAGIARAEGRNLEAMARDLRYAFFFSLIRQGRLDRIVTAHTANDQAETVLLRLIRGAGTRGLGGIHPELAGGVARPFLMLTRGEIEAEITRRGLAYRVDPTNRQMRFTRNRLRELVLPLLERDFNPRVVLSLAGFADRARDDEAFLEEQAKDRCNAWLRREGGALRIPARRLADFPAAIARRVLRRLVVEAAGAKAGQVAIGHGEMERLIGLAANGRSGTRITLGAGVEARKEFEWLVIAPARPEACDQTPVRRNGFRHRIEPPATVAIPELGLRLCFNFVDGAGAKGSEGEYTDKSEGVWLGSANLTDPLILRNWRAGDRTLLPGHTNPVKLKELFQRRHVPVVERAWWPVLEYSGEIIWAKGFTLARRERRAPGRRLMIGEELV